MREPSKRPFEVGDIVTFGEYPQKWRVTFVPDTGGPEGVQFKLVPK